MSEARSSRDSQASAPRKPGRPRKEGEHKSCFLTLRLTPSISAAVKERGGSKWLWNLILEKLENEESEDCFSESQEGTFTLPLLDLRAACGFPAPAADTGVEETDIYSLLVRHPGKTILVEASGDSMVDAGIYEGDLLVVDLAAEPRSGDIVLVCYDGNFIVKRLRISDGWPVLKSENSLENYPPLRPSEGEQFDIQGVVRNIIRSL